VLRSTAFLAVEVVGGDGHAAEAITPPLAQAMAASRSLIAPEQACTGTVTENRTKSRSSQRKEYVTAPRITALPRRPRPRYCSNQALLGRQGNMVRPLALKIGPGDFCFAAVHCFPTLCFARFSNERPRIGVHLHHQA
jgi:hypothetical protein